MKRLFDWQAVLGLILVVLSAVVYFIHYVIFRDARHIFLYLIGDIAFVFLEVLFVSLIINRLLEYRDKRAVLKKLNMVIGTFFTETGTELLKMCSLLDPEAYKITDLLKVNADWSDAEFKAVKKKISLHEFNIACEKNDLMDLKDILVKNRQFLLNLLGNPNLLEHESFTDLLWAVFHLTDEMAHRVDFGNIPETDYKHLTGDIKRAYSQLVSEWLDYMEHLKYDYPYLFSMAIRTNPFDANVSVEVK